MAKLSRCSLIILLVLGISTPTHKTYAGGSGLGGIATEATQILNNIQLLGINVAEAKQLVNQAQQLINEAIMIENQIKNLVRLANNPMAFVRSLMELKSVVQRGRILSYVSSAIESEYQTKYPGYSTYSSPGGLTSSQIIQKYDDWSQDNEDTIIAHLQSAGLQEDTILNEEIRVDTLVSLSQNAEGRLAAIQAGNQIAAEQVRGLQRLRKLMLDQAQFNANFAAINKDKGDVDLAKWRQHTDTGTPTNTMDGSNMNNSIMALP